MKFARAWIAAAVCSTAALSAHAQPRYPDKPVRIILPYSAGSGPDAVMRHVGEKLARAWGQPVVVDNRPGANGWIAIDAARQAAPDAHTLVQLDNSHLALQRHLYKRLPFDPSGDFEPVAPLFTTHFFVVVPASSRWTSVAELIDAAKARGGALSYGSWGHGSVGHVGAAMLGAATGVQMMHVPFKELSQLYVAVGNGEVDWAFGTAGSAGPMHRAGRVRFLAIAAPQRLAAFADVPTVSEAGGPAAFELRGWVALLAPRGTPAAIVERINTDVAAALSQADVRERLSAFGFESWPASSTRELATAIERDSRAFGDVARRVKISLD